MPTKLTIEEFIERATATHGDKYNYSLVVYKNAHTKVKIICSVHGTFEQMPIEHYRGKGCPLCANNTKKTTDQFIIEAIQVHDNKYDYSLAKYHTNNTKVKIICAEHGIFKQTPSAHLGGQGCPLCNNSKGELQISKVLSEQNIQFAQEYIFDDLLSDKGYPLRFDFYIPTGNTCIEYDGEFHYKSIIDSNLSRQQLHDKLKDEYCKNNNIHLIRIPYTNFINIEEILINKLTSII